MWPIIFSSTTSDFAIREKPKPKPCGRPPKTAAVVEDSDQEEAGPEAPEDDNQEEEPTYVTTDYIHVTISANGYQVLEKSPLEDGFHQTGLGMSSRAPESSESLCTRWELV